MSGYSPENDAPIQRGVRWSFTWPRTQVWPEPGYVLDLSVRPIPPGETGGAA